MKHALRQIWLDLTADRRKACVLGALLLIATMLGLRAAFKSSGPAVAAAAASAAQRTTTQPQQPTAPHPGAVAVQTHTAGSADNQPAPRMLRLTPPHVYSRSGMPSRDIFSVSDAHFPPAAVAAKPNDGPKSTDPPADIIDTTAERAAAAHARLQAEADKLRVRSIALGARAIAILEITNGPDGAARRTRVVRAGDVVAGFTVLAVAASGVLLEQDGVSIELPPPAPAGAKP